ncbi:MAG: HAMP domain-containing histidine kinase [Solirubrobacterales bacterium]|nr:HAMP domain-containing histidine kinase [Solirubrobacterales bacterium]
MRLSLANKLVLVLSAVTLVAIAALYVYLAPGLQTRLLDQKLGALAASARQNSGSVAQAVASSPSLRGVKQEVDAAARNSGDRVTLLTVALVQGGLQVSPEADSSTPVAAQTLGFPVAYKAASTGKLITGTESTGAGSFAEAAYPFTHAGGIAVVVYSASVSDVVRSVAIVRHEILVAGGIALLLGLLGSYLVARALARRVKRLERAAEQVAAGNFRHPITVDSTDELGQLALAFNEMQRQLLQLELARKRFISTASHELRTPIFSLGGFVELLEDEQLEPETRRRFLDQLRNQVERLRKLSVDLLDLSRLESGSLELRSEEVDLSELTRSVSGEFEPALAQHDSQLELQLRGSPISAVCDPVRVAQVVRILIDNALIHTPTGTRITVTAGQENGYVRLAVRDDGEGIEDQAALRVFEPFFTADGAQGSGLGLAIASELAQRMAGRLSVHSTPGDTTFTLEIPSAAASTGSADG